MLWFLIIIIAVVMVWAATAGHVKSDSGSSRADSEEDETDEIMDIDDPRVPEVIREHAARFKTPVRFVTFCGPDIVLSAEDGEVIDICALTGC
jgi:hypothetical protein